MSAPSVLRAIRSGRLKSCLVLDETGKQKIASLELADAEWDANTDLTKAPTYVKERAGQKPAPAAPKTAAAPTQAPPAAPPPPAAETPDEDGGVPLMHGTMTLAEATVAEKFWSARKKELDYQRERGELVSAKDVAAMLAQTFTLCRTKLLAIPSKAKTALPNLSPADVGTLDGLIRDALADLASSPVALIAPSAADGTVAA